MPENQLAVALPLGLLSFATRPSHSAVLGLSCIAEAPSTSQSALA